jgi:hypothetical protein
VQHGRVVGRDASGQAMVVPLSVLSDTNV